MKLTYVSNARIPTEKAHGIHIMKMCEVFAQVAEVELVVPRRFNKIKEEPFDYYGMAETRFRFPIKRLPCLDLIRWDRYIGHLGLWVESVTFAFFVFWYMLFKKADVIYTRDKFLLPLVLFKKNLIFESHTSPQNYFLYSPFLKRLKGIVVITEKLKELLIDRGIKKNKILVAPDGVDLKMFDIQCSKSEARQKLNLPQDKKIAVYTGHSYKWKGTQTLAEASKHLPEDVKVVFVEGRPYPEIPYWLKAADVLVLPNSGEEEISRYWTSPMKMFEYMASQRPIVASDLASIREILNKDNAILVEPDNPQALAQGIKEALANPQLSGRISEQAHLDVKKYDWSKRVENILNFVLNGGIEK